MKHCQSQLVSYKVEWFCSLAGFSWWSGLFIFLFFFVSVSSNALSCWTFFVLIPFLKSREKALVERPGGEGCIITANYSCVRTYSVPATAVVENQQTLLLLLFLTAEQYTLCICWYFATIFILFLIYIQPKEKKRKHQFFLFYQAEHKQERLLADNTVCVK